MEFEDALPAIIEKKDFLTVEKIMARRRNGATNAKEIYALSGRIFCECGAAMS